MSANCPVCDASSGLLDVVDFSKSCEELNGKFLPLSGMPIYYARCDSCGFTFSPTMYSWSIDEFSQFVYNEGYVEIDPDYVTFRPNGNASMLTSLVKSVPPGFRHLDYGGGEGLLSEMMRDQGWDSQSYDPFVDGPLVASNYGTFDLVTAFEVFEHVPDVNRLMTDLVDLMKRPGIVLFSTILSDGEIHKNQRLQWWYAAPRNGHISLFTRTSLERLAARNDINFGSFSETLHAVWNEFPAWAAHWLGGKTKLPTASNAG